MGQKNRADIRRGVRSRIRKKVRGSAERPRLAVFRSVNHIYAQLIDDDNGKTLATASTTEKDFGGRRSGTCAGNKTAVLAQVVGDLVSVKNNGYIKECEQNDQRDKYEFVIRITTVKLLEKCVDTAPG